MKTIKEFNRQLNESYKKEDAFSRWADYRKSLTDFVYDGLAPQANKTDSTLIVGAGHLNDLDVEKLYDFATHISFLDVDTHITMKALEERNIPHTSYSLIEQDLTCLDGSLHEKLNESIHALASEQNDHLFLQLMGQHAISYDMGKFDRIIILPIYTQILFNQLMQTCISINGDLQHETQILIMEKVAHLISLINSELINHLKKDGVLIAFSDVLEYKGSDQTAQALINCYSSESLEKFNTLANDVYTSYLENFGYTLGAFGIYDMSSKIEKSADKFLMWEFDNQRKFLVKGISGTNK